MTTVIKISGKPIHEPASTTELWRTLARCAGDAVIVHGGGVQVDALFDRLGVRVERRDGIRLTPPDHMPLVAGVLAGEVNQTLTGLLRSVGAPAVGLSLVSSGIVEAEVNPAVGGRVGRITGGDADTIRVLLKSGLLPVVASIAADAQGGLLNVNADDAAAGVAAALGADRLVLLTDVNGVLDASSTTVSMLDSNTAREMIEAGVIRGGMVAKVRAILAMAARFTGEVVIAGWDQAEAAIAGATGVGTRVGATEENER